MTSKVCFKCGHKKDISEFYAHPKMKDGRLNKCKECTKKDNKNNYVSDREKHAAYERRRFKSPERKAKILEYQRRRRAKDPVKTKARQATAYALRKGKLRRLPCEVCGSPKSQAHHADYTKPLEVRWLCFQHHRELEHGHTVTEQNKGKPA